MTKKYSKNCVIISTAYYSPAKCITHQRLTSIEIYDNLNGGKLPTHGKLSQVQKEIQNLLCPVCHVYHVTSDTVHVLLII